MWFSIECLQKQKNPKHWVNSVTSKEANKHQLLWKQIAINETGNNIILTCFYYLGQVICLITWSTTSMISLIAFHLKLVIVRTTAHTTCTVCLVFNGTSSQDRSISEKRNNSWSTIRVNYWHGSDSKLITTDWNRLLSHSMPDLAMLTLEHVSNPDKKH